ncbi:MAG: flagellar hook-associated protein FlgK [Candidatus Krumholzibacteria bacterium]|nr:flagellar hook-associated protein FlgK [Candidatus Krumholzibacteria bacterium]
MAGLNSIMDNSLSALFAAQAGLATTGHNIANANTPGYSRQQAIFAPRKASIMPYGSIGRGVEIQGIRRVQDEFLLQNMRIQKSRLENYAQTDTTLYEIEAILGSVDNDHLGAAMTEFFSSWNSMSQPPITSSMRAAVVSSAQSLITDFHAVDDSLDDLAGQIEVSIQAELTNLNGMLSEVGHMNTQIMAAESNGEPANDLRDQRDLLITEISKIAEVSVLEREDGSKDLILAGRTMVARASVTHFSSTYRTGDNGYEMVVVTEDTMQDVTISPGRLQGLLTSRDVQIKNARDDLDAVAKKLIDEVNALHTQGRTATSSGLVFFTGDSMHTIELNSAIADDSSLVATGPTLAEGDNTLALAIANLANVSSTGSGDQTVSDVYRTVLIGVASERSSFEFLVENQQNVVAALETRMASISGVSLDEEGANMVRYQNSYNAAAKIISTVQEMYDALMRMI